MATSGLYRGFSTYNRARKFSIMDTELVKQDLFNHLNIRKGEKLMNPNFGTVIWGLLFEPFTPEIKNIIVEDLKTIVGTDPRIGLTRLIVQDYFNGIQVEMSLSYRSGNMVETISLQFDKNSKTMFAATKTQ